MMPRQRALAVVLTCFLFLTASRAAAIDLYWIDTSWGAPKLNRSDENGLGVTTVMLTPGISAPLGSLTMPPNWALPP